MRVKTRYALILIIILSISAIVPNLITNARYYSDINMESEIPVGLMIFELIPNEENNYTLTKGENIILNYTLSNKDSQNHINQVDFDYAISILDEAGIDALTYTVDIDDDNSSLSSDGQTEEIRNIAITMFCPEDYSGETNLNYKVKIIATVASTASNENPITVEKNVDMGITIQNASGNNLLMTSKTLFNNPVINSVNNEEETVEELEQTSGNVESENTEENNGQENTNTVNLNMVEESSEADNEMIKEEVVVIEPSNSELEENNKTENLNTNEIDNSEENTESNQNQIQTT